MGAGFPAPAEGKRRRWRQKRTWRSRPKMRRRSCPLLPAEHHSCHGRKGHIHTHEHRRSSVCYLAPYGTRSSAIELPRTVFLNLPHPFIWPILAYLSAYCGKKHRSTHIYSIAFPKRRPGVGAAAVCGGRGVCRGLRPRRQTRAVHRRRPNSPSGPQRSRPNMEQLKRLTA